MFKDEIKIGNIYGFDILDKLNNYPYTKTVKVIRLMENSSVGVQCIQTGERFITLCYYLIDLNEAKMILKNYEENMEYEEEDRLSKGFKKKVKKLREIVIYSMDQDSCINYSNSLEG